MDEKEGVLSTCTRPVTAIVWWSCSRAPLSLLWHTVKDKDMSKVYETPEHPWCCLMLLIWGGGPGGCEVIGHTDASNCPWIGQEMLNRYKY